MNRGWRFCRPYRVLNRDARLRLLVPDGVRFWAVFGRCCSEVAPKFTPVPLVSSSLGCRDVDGVKTCRHSGHASRGTHLPNGATHKPYLNRSSKPPVPPDPTLSTTPQLMVLIVRCMDFSVGTDADGTRHHADRARGVQCPLPQRHACGGRAAYRPRELAS